MHDIVYILDNNMDSAEELRYSLRSLVNFPRGKVWFFGHVPEGFKPDRHRRFTQKGSTSWERVRNAIYKVCTTSQVSESFWLFNDDFFLLDPVEGEPVYRRRGTIADHVEQIRRLHGESRYATECLLKVAEEMERRGLDTYDYTLHVPMLIQKEKALEAMDEHPDLVGFRNLYGNYAAIGGDEIDDVKVTSIHELPEPGQQFMSTDDQAFRSGAAGAYLFQRFKDKSRWEE